MYNEYVTGEVDYHEDLLLREWEYYCLYEEVAIDDGEEEEEEKTLDKPIKDARITE